MDYRLIRSNRKTLALQIGPEGLTVRAPYGVSRAQIEDFLRRQQGWIEKHSKAIEPPAPEELLSPEQVRALAQEALAVIPQRVAYFAPLVGVSYGRITIRNQRTRWGSCSAQGNLNFNCLLMLAPPEVLDAVVVHELCHRKHPNHSKAFYDEVLRVYPNYRACDRWLKEYGPALMRRMAG